MGCRAEKKEELMPGLVSDIAEIAEVNTQSEGCHKDTKGYVKITEGSVKNVLLAEKGYQASEFGQGTLNNILNPCGYTLKKTLKNLPLKPIAETDAIFDNIAR